MTFWVFETFCEIQPKDEWKEKLIQCYENRRMRASVIKEIETLDWANVVKPSSQEERFEFQLHKSNSTENWLKAEEFEERLRAHCSFIFVNAANMKKGRQLRKRFRGFDGGSHLYWSKGKKKEMGFSSGKGQVQQTLL